VGFARFDDGSGSKLFVSGGFTIPGDDSIQYIAAWDGSEWSRVGDHPPNGLVLSLAVFDDGSGLALYAAGYFTMAGGMPASNIARWDGTSWAAVGPVVPNPVGIQHLAVFDDGRGSRLYAGGNFTSIGGVAANRIARLDKGGWSALQSGLQGGDPSIIDAMQPFDDGSGPALYVSGQFTSAGGVAVNGLARWNGRQWSSIGGAGTPGGRRVYALETFDDGSGPALYVGGDFEIFGGVSAHNLARWNGQTWSNVAGSMNAEGEVYCLAAVNGGSSNALYVGGPFVSAGGVAVRRAAKWDGATWTPLGTGLAAYARTAFAELQGDDAVVWMGGPFMIAGSITSPGLAKWSGEEWEAVGDGLMAPAAPNEFSLGAIGSLTLQAQTALYLCGQFAFINGKPCNSIARFDGNRWQPLGTGVWFDSALPPITFDATVFDDGRGEALYVGGTFLKAGTRGCALHRSMGRQRVDWSRRRGQHKRRNTVRL
jgi:hypothetical protein